MEANFFITWSSGWWSQSIGSILSKRPLGLGVSETSADVSLEPLAQLFNRNLVNIKLQLLLQIIKILVSRCSPATHAVPSSAPTRVSLSEDCAAPLQHCSNHLHNKHQ